MSSGSGYLYIVYGDKRYFKEAETSALSLRRHDTSAQIAMITDDLSKVDVDSKLWDQILPYPEFRLHSKDDGFVDGKFEFKVDTMHLSPFEHTLFVDTDTYFLGPVKGLFELLRFYDFALLPKSGEGNIKDPGHYHEVIEGFTPYNTGIILYRDTPAVATVFELWRTYYRTQRSIQRSKNDQAYFLLALATTPSVKVHALPATYNARFNGFLGLTGKVKVLHAAGMKGLKEAGYEAVASTINKTTENRGWDAKRKIVYTK